MDMMGFLFCFLVQARHISLTALLTSLLHWATFTTILHNITFNAITPKMIFFILLLNICCVVAHCTRLNEMRTMSIHNMFVLRNKKSSGLESPYIYGSNIILSVHMYKT